ncbi:hypothetical protein [Bradyrhizobium sp. WSM471]|uniref:hypothetical protein n=1 Tax=Bradyrhizobium sp. WSM471 TaxID=319017 RepID=UPI00055B08FB|nr:MULTISPECIES: hypothetical protein [Bradyrhizobium]UFW43086.1 hypothetical protein BcanWSM471_08260 [Bradyrhizobium canariense]
MNSVGRWYVVQDSGVQRWFNPAANRASRRPASQCIDENNRLNGTVVPMNGTTCKVEIPGAGSLQVLAINVEHFGRSTVPERVILNPVPGSLPNSVNARVTDLVYLAMNRPGFAGGSNS